MVRSYFLVTLLQVGRKKMGREENYFRKAKRVGDTLFPPPQDHASPEPVTVVLNCSLPFC